MRLRIINPASSLFQISQEKERREKDRVSLIAWIALTVCMEEVRKPGLKAAVDATGRKLGKQSRMPLPDCQMLDICRGRQFYPFVFIFTIIGGVMVGVSALCFGGWWF